MRTVLTSTRNPRVVAARRLLRRTHRTSAGAFLLEGPTAIEDVVAARPGAVKEIFAVPGEEIGSLASAAAEVGIEIVEVSPQVLNALTETVTPQGAVAVVASPEATLDALVERVRSVLVLAGLNDPGNAGTLIRTAAAAGADAVVFTEGSVDPFNPKVVRASAAALFLVPFVRDASLEEVARRLRAAGCRLLGAAAQGSNAFTDVDLSAPSAIFVGNEAGGLGPGATALMDEIVAVPMPGGTDSLNAAVAGSILLFEAVRQRHFRR